MLVFALSSYGQEQLIKMDSKEIALESVFQYLESKHGFLFSYIEKDVERVVVKPYNKTSTINVFLEKTLQSTGLNFEIIEKNYIVISKRNNALGQNIEEDILRTHLCGRVVDVFSQEPLPFANVYFPRTKDGVMTADDGNFEISTKMESNDTIVISYVGFQSKKMLAKNFTSKPCQTISLDLLEFSEDFVVVLDYLTDGVELNDNGAYTKLKPKRIGVLPGQAEPNILKTIQFLPGISSPDRSASGIHIRGGTPDQNLILWEDIPIYHAAHYFGMLSAFNPYLIDEAKIFRGGFNAEYGGRISGVIDLKSNNNTNTENDFSVGTNLINAYANGKFSFLQKKASVIFSVRRSFSDFWQSPTFQDVTQRIQQGVLYQLPNQIQLDTNIRFENKFKFTDLNLKSIYKISEKDKLSAAYFFGNNDFRSTVYDDNIDQKQSDSLYLTNMGASIIWNRQWNSKFMTRLSGVVSDYQYEYEYSVVTDQNQNNKSGIKSSEIREQQINFLGSHTLPFNQTIKAGYQISHYDVGFKIEKESKRDRQANQNKKYNSLMHVLHGSWNTDPEKKWGVETGLRWSYYQDEEQFFLEPRGRLWYRISNNLKVFLNSGKYYQFLSQLIELDGDRASIETPVWVLTGDEEVPILDAIQHQVGILYDKNNWVIDVQLYYKNVNGMTSLATGFGESLSDRFHVGKANIKGIDFLLKKRWKNYRSWISYSLGRIDHEFETFFDSEFLSSYDQTHVFNWVNMLKYKNWEFSLGWKFSSGTPHSSLQNFKIEQQGMGTDEQERLDPIVDEFNSERLSPLHHLDGSVLYNFYSKNNKWKGIIGLSLFNIYNQKNTYQRGFLIDSQDNNSSELRYTDKTDVGFMPNFVLRFEW